MGTKKNNNSGNKAGYITKFVAASNKKRETNQWSSLLDRSLWSLDSAESCSKIKTFDSLSQKLGKLPNMSGWLFGVSKSAWYPVPPRLEATQQGSHQPTCMILVLVKVICFSHHYMSSKCISDKCFKNLYICNIYIIYACIYIVIIDAWFRLQKTHNNEEFNGIDTKTNCHGAAIWLLVSSLFKRSLICETSRLKPNHGGCPRTPGSFHPFVGSAPKLATILQLCWNHEPAFLLLVESACL